MKKRITLIVAILVIAVVIILLAVSGAKSDRIEGTYILKDASGTASEMFKATVDDATLTINADDSGTFTMLGQETPVAVNEKESKISFDGGKNYSAYVLDGKKLTIEKDGYKVIFKKK